MPPNWPPSLYPQPLQNFFYTAAEESLLKSDHVTLLLNSQMASLGIKSQAPALPFKALHHFPLILFGAHNFDQSCVPMC